MLDWQPMTTAPRDETHVLLFTKRGQFEAWFSKGSWSEHYEYGSEYEGPVWVCVDDTFQIEVEEFETGFGDGEALAWATLPTPPNL